MHRMLTAVLLLVALMTTAPLAVAQEATPAAGMAGRDRLFADTMGLPELAITATADGFEGVPAETTAGRYVVTLTATAVVEAGAAVEFLMLPEGMTFADFTALFAGPPEGGAMGSPAAEMGAPMGSPEAGGGEGEMGAPEWFYRTHLAGGPAADAGFSSQAIVDLRPGTYVVWGGDPTAPQAPVEMTVTGDAMASPAAGAEPTADVTITMFEYGFKVDGQLTPGQQVVKVTNVGAQPHFTIMLGPTGPITKEQIGKVLEAEMSGTPTADVAAELGISNPDEWQFAAYAGTLSSMGTEWIPVDLEPGVYVLVCFIPDIEDGMPHAFHGMYEIVTVGEGGTPTA